MDTAITPPKQQEKVGGVSPISLVRQCGLLAITAGASMVLAPLVHPESPQSAAWVSVHLLYFATLVVILLVLVGILTRQFRRAGRLGVAGFLVAFVGTAMMLLEGREHLFSPDFGVGTPLGLWELISASLIFSFGYILLGIVIARAGVLPRAAGILLAVGGPIVAFSPPIGILPVLIVGHALFGSGLAWLGYALWHGTEHEHLPVGTRTMAARISGS
jgi:hypothetical protein